MMVCSEFVIVLLDELLLLVDDMLLLFQLDLSLDLFDDILESV